MKNMRWTSLLFLIFWLGCKEKEVKPVDTTVKQEVKPMSFVLAGQTPHDITSFTEGLFFHNGTLYEGTGSPQELTQTRSIAGPVDIATGKIDVKVELDKSKFFGEGVCILNDKLYQLTYKNQLAFIYDATTYKNIGTFKYTSAEGWGLTTDGKELIMSDGTDKLTFIDPVSYKETRELYVKANGSPVYHLNELEYINGNLYANIWMTTQIARIDPASGNVTGVLDLSSLLSDAKSKNPQCAEMNGIAYNPASGQLWLTGKLWPAIYQIQCEL